MLRAVQQKKTMNYGNFDLDLETTFSLRKVRLVSITC